MKEGKERKKLNGETRQQTKMKASVMGDANAEDNSEVMTTQQNCAATTTTATTAVRCSSTKTSNIHQKYICPLP